MIMMIIVVVVDSNYNYVSLWLQKGFINSVVNTVSL